MSEFNFKSSVCTSRKQSERLLALGLKPETADMSSDGWNDPVVSWVMEWSEKVIESGRLPAWSLGRLLEICGKDRLPISFHKKGKVKIRVNHIHPTHDGRSGYNYYDSIIGCIEWLIKEGYFNKEYLEE